MPAEQITIAGRVFRVSNPYSEGHVLTAPEASAFNQLFHENVRNNLAKKIKDLPEDQAQAAVDEYSQNYEFGQRVGGGGGPRDPVKVEAMRIGRELIKRAILAKGLKLENFTAKDISDRAAAELEKHPEWLEEAKNRVEAQRQLAAVELDLDAA